MIVYVKSVIKIWELRFIIILRDVIISFIFCYDWFYIYRGDGFGYYSDIGGCGGFGIDYNYWGVRVGR